MHRPPYMGLCGGFAYSQNTNTTKRYFVWSHKLISNSTKLSDIDFTYLCVRTPANSPNISAYKNQTHVGRTCYVSNTVPAVVYYASSNECAQ